MNNEQYKLIDKFFTEILTDLEGVPEEFEEAFENHLESILL